MNVTQSRKKKILWPRISIIFFGKVVMYVYKFVSRSWVKLNRVDDDTTRRLQFFLENVLLSVSYCLNESVWNKSFSSRKVEPLWMRHLQKWTVVPVVVWCSTGGSHYWPHLNLASERSVVKGTFLSKMFVRRWSASLSRKIWVFQKFTLLCVQ